MGMFEKQNFRGRKADNLYVHCGGRAAELEIALDGCFP